MNDESISNSFNERVAATLSSFADAVLSAPRSRGSVPVFSTPATESSTKLNFPDSPFFRSVKRTRPAYFLDRPLKRRAPTPETIVSKSMTATPLPAVDENIRQNIRRDSELVDARVKIVQLEKVISELKMAHQKKELEYETELQELRQDHRNDREALEDAVVKLSQYEKKASEYKEACDEHRSQSEKDRHALNSSALETAKEKFDLETSLEKVHASLRIATAEAQSEKMRLEDELEKLNYKLQEVQDTNKQIQDQLSQKDKRIKDLEGFENQVYAANEQILELQKKLGDQEEMTILQSMLRERLVKVAELQQANDTLSAENKALQEALKISLVHEEHIHDLERKLTHAELSSEKLHQAQKRVALLESNLSAWESLARQCNPEAKEVTCASIADAIRNLQQKELLLASQIGKLESNLRASERAQQKSQEELQHTQEEVMSITEQGKQHEETIKKLRRKLLLYSKECNSLKSVLNSYESEVTVNPSEVQTERLCVLEQLLQSYKDMLEQAPEQNVKCTEGGVESTDYTRQEIDKLTLEKQELLQEKEALLAELNARTMRGDFDPSKTTVVHFKQNPVTEAQAARANELTQLQNENETLKQRIKVLESGEILNVTAQVEQRLQEEPSSAEIKDMRNQLLSSQLKCQRLVELFKTTSHEFREVVQMLTGYRIDSSQPKHYRVSSSFASSPEEYLLFQWASGQLNMLETPYSTSLLDLINLHLKQHHSIPTFLSTLTLQLFSQQTVMQEMPSASAEDEIVMVDDE